MENDNNDCPTIELKIAFDYGNDWKYRIALNGRKIEALYLDGRRQVDAPERDWDGEPCTEVNEKDGRIRELESLVRDMLFAIRLGSMSDLTDKDVLKSWLRDFSERASDLGLMEVDV